MVQKLECKGTIEGGDGTHSPCDKHVLYTPKKVFSMTERSQKTKTVYLKCDRGHEHAYKVKA